MRDILDVLRFCAASMRAVIRPTDNERERFEKKSQEIIDRVASRHP